MSEHSSVISREFNLIRKHVNAVLRLLDGGATVPFIARYRKEATGGMDETMIRNVQLRHNALTELDKRKAFVIEAIEAHEAMTDELRQRIDETLDPVAIEDIYMPFKPRRRTRAQAARELGLEPLARILMAQNSPDIRRAARKFVGNEVADVDAALAGASDIVAEWVAESEKARTIVRSRFNRSGKVISRVAKGKDNEAGSNYQNYFDFSEPVRTCNSHRYLAMRRGEDEGVLNVSISIDDDEMADRLCRMFVKSGADDQSAALVKAAVVDGYKRLLRPSIETEIAAVLKEKSDAAAISLFADNVHQLLMAPPVEGKRVMAIDPGFRTGCKVVCLDVRGDLLAHEVIYPNPPANDFYGASEALLYMVDRYQIDAIAIGNGTAGRETERFISSLQFPRRVQVCLVSEQGASIYSASEAAIEEFPDEDITVRGAVSIGRRFIDPLAELVKIDPRSIGVGQYQHDVSQPALRDALDYTVQSCVNSVGVNLNTASRQLLSYVSGIGPQLAANIVAYRSEHGNFKTRNELMNVPRMGEKTFQQCAGFLRIPRGENVLDNTGIHPESYELVERMASDAGVEVERLTRDKRLLHSIELDPYVTKTCGLPTLTDIIIELEKPGRDPREKVEEKVYDEGVRKIDDLHLGMEMTGKVNNITAFGVFVDLGLKENGLIHISQLSDDYISTPHDVVRIGQIVKVKVLDVDAPRGRIALTMKGIPQ